MLFRVQKETDVIQFPKRDPSSETFLTFDVSERIAVILRRWMESKFSMFHITVLPTCQSLQPTLAHIQGCDQSKNYGSAIR